MKLLHILKASAVLGLYFGAAVPAMHPAVADDAIPANPVGMQDAALAVAAPYKATIFADGIGPVRHIVAGADGWIYGALVRITGGYGGVAMRDTDGDGGADDVKYFAPGMQGTGIGIDGGYLYYGADTQIVRWPLSAGPVPEGVGEVVISGFPEQRAHAAKSLAFDGAGHMYVNVGVPSNNCMAETRTKGSPGQRPCPELAEHGGVYEVSLETMGQSFADAVRYSTGHRNAVALSFNPADKSVYLVQHGRDQLGQFFPELYDAQANAELPAEEFHKVERGDNLGWPYSYFDHRVGERIVSPEFGGDGKTVSNEGKKPLIGFPGHWAPNGLLFPQGEAFAHGALIAFHGSWNRAPEVQAGYRVVFVPMNARGEITGEWTTFIDGFAGPEAVRSSRQAKHRPIGLTEDASGAIYVSSSMSGGRIWKVTQ